MNVFPYKYICLLIVLNMCWVVIHTISSGFIRTSSNLCIFNLCKNNISQNRNFEFPTTPGSFALTSQNRLVDLSEALYKEHAYEDET